MTESIAISMCLCYTYTEVTAMDFKVNIDQFDGPLDLMLHLIKEGELDLFDLDIFKLTDQYLLYKALYPFRKRDRRDSKQKVSVHKV